MNKKEEKLNAESWMGKHPPRRILAVRLQAFGDTVITLPWLASLREQFPQARIDFLTLGKNAELPMALNLFDHVYKLQGAVAKNQFLFANLMLPILSFKRYDVVIDLQRNNISRWIRFWLFPKAWSEIERFSRTLAGEKFRACIEAAGFKGVGIPHELKLKKDTGKQILIEHGWNGTDKLIVLNPAGAFANRNWPDQNYIDFSNALIREKGPGFVFLFLGIDRIKEKADIISAGIKARTINLVNHLTPSSSFSVLRHVHFVLSEDSGLMHMAWVQCIPTLALFGSSPSYWSSPMGSRTKCLHSSDLPCGNCCSEVCRFGDVHCLTRYSPEFVLGEAQKLMENSEK